MKIAVKRLIRDQKGQAMVMAVILLLVSGLVVSSLMSYMGTGLVTGRVYESRVAELYAADAGVEDAVWKIQNDIGLCPGNPSTTYNISGINSNSVEVTITYVTNTTNNNTTTVTYQVESTATNDGSGTKIEAYVSATTVTGNFSGILENVITSPCDYTLGGPTQVDPPEGEEHGPEANYPGDWPTGEILSEMYWDSVKDYPYTSGTLDVKDYAAGIGPLYRDGTLDIENTGTAGSTVQLTGTVYVTGDTLIGMTDKAFTLDLNEQTIFVLSDSGAAPEDDPCNPGNEYALKIGTKCTLTGSGCIIAVGGIEFKPNLAFTEGDFVFVLSLGGKTYMQPNGDFYGTLAGSAEVYIQNGDAHWFDSPFIDEGLNFPYTAVVNRFDTIASWDVNQL
jgi:Tfp pilus assembly protein PilX